ncbi:hypothetical protein [Aerolutibacter ruishenii]|uniref:Uncharacterized protein n=1 Tax=Aerolutibacter ruishenii TaxID=686800 RepID=A0A562M135_9GAMM|nr:hypothetical protein [Lysobacter ruishenii]TWI13532.1 hypothetical protein IP93_00694 [Lysobacter ruishenii]
MAEPTPLDDLVLRCKTPEDCDRLITNATAKGRPDLVPQALQHKVNLRTASHLPPPTNDVKRDCVQAIYAYEEILFMTHGRRLRAGRTRQAVDNKGLIAAFEGFVNRPDGAAGFKNLRDAGLHNFAYEAVVARHPQAFSIEAVERARQRLAQFQE